MYVRFVTPLIHPESGAECGFFRASCYLRRIDCPDWIHAELREQFGWFNDNLPMPRHVVRHFTRRDSLHGVCWFRSGARECIDRARYCAWLITEGGLPVEAIKLREVRELIWRDDHQIVTPSRRAPRAFRGRPPSRWHWQ
jgi:hypothetical protein